MNRNIAKERMVAAISAFFGLLALTLASIGIFGVASVDINASATAEASPTASVQCAKPFIIPDRWIEQTGNANWFDYTDSHNNVLANPDVYRPVCAGAPNVSIAPPDADLAALLAAADAIVTMNSTVAIDGLVLGIPALVIGLPNNLSPFVDAGVMLGASAADEIASGLRTLLYDAGVRRALIDRGRLFADRFGMRADGRAAERTAAEILALVPARRLDSHA